MKVRLFKIYHNNSNYATDLYNWMSGKISNIQGVAIFTSPTKPSSETGINHCEQYDSFNSPSLNFNCGGIFNSGHGTNENQVNLRFQAYTNQSQRTIKKYGSFDHSHGYLQEGKPWYGANMVYTHQYLHR